jgi:hypothetical protein
MVDHEVKLQGAAIKGTVSTAPVLIGRQDPDFLNTVLREVRSDSGRTDLQNTVVKNGSSSLPALLYQPVQRVMHIALMEAFCATPGNPRLDPAKIDSAGVVIRRVPVDKAAKPDFHSGTMEAWMQDSQGNLGWKQLNALQQDLEPDANRRPMLHTGQTYLDKILDNRLNNSPRSEAISPAFAAPPDVCADAKQTLIYALLPLSSSELSRPAPPPQTLDRVALLQYLPVLIKVGNNIAPLAGKSVTADYASEDYLRRVLSVTDQNAFKSFLMLLNAAMGFGILDNDPKAESQALRSKLHQLSVAFAGPPAKTQPLDEFLVNAKAVLIDCDPAASSQLLMPSKWPQVTPQQQEGILAAVQAIVNQRISDLHRNGAGDAQGRGRFQNPDRIYQVRGFVRVKCEEQCPPKIVWTDPSIYFRIAPWYDGPGVPAPPVVLPDLTDRNVLNKLKPNVSFGVPAGLFNAIQGASLDGLMKGKKGGGGGLSLDWICGFNIPIITICAFFVLNIFLALLNIVFFWLPLVKICIPIPKGTLNSD